METGLQALLISLVINEMIKQADKKSIRISILLGLLYLTRPDSLIQISVVFLFRGYLIFKNKILIKEFLQEVGIFLIFPLSTTIFRYNYYGEWVPNTYILKVQGMTIIDRVLLNGINYIEPFINFSYPILLLVLFSIIIKPSYEKFLFATIPLSAIVYSIFIGGDAFRLWRFIAPFAPIFFIVLLKDLPEIFRGLFQGLRNKFLGRYREGAAVVTLSLLFLFLGRPHYSYYSAFMQPESEEVAGINTAIFLNRILEDEASVGVFFAGMVPFYTDFYAIDFLGRTDPNIAKAQPDISGTVSWNGLTSVPGHNKYNLEYSILERTPTYIEGTSWGREDITIEALTNYVEIPIDFQTTAPFDQSKVLILNNSTNVKWDSLDFYNQVNTRLFSTTSTLGDILTFMEEPLGTWGIEGIGSDSFLWLGEGLDQGFHGVIFSDRDILVDFVFHFEPGPSRHDSVRHVEFTFKNQESMIRDGETQTIEFDRPVEHGISYNLSPGINEIWLSVLDEATISVLPNGDKRKLLVMLDRIDVVPIDK
jgi:hypothetical protein